MNIEYGIWSRLYHNMYITTKIVKYIQYDIRTHTPDIQEVAQLHRI